MHTWRWMISLPAAFWIKFSLLPWSFPDWVTRFCMCYGTVLQVKNPKRRFPKGGSGSGIALVGHLPPHNVQPPPASVTLPLQVLLCQQLSLFSFDFSINLLRGSFQKTFIHDVYTSYSHIICAYFIFMYLYLCKNASVHIFCHHGIVIFLWAAPPPLLALPSHCTQHSSRAVWSSHPNSTQGHRWPCHLPTHWHLLLPILKPVRALISLLDTIVRTDFKELWNCKRVNTAMLKTAEADNCH